MMKSKFIDKFELVTKKLKLIDKFILLESATLFLVIAFSMFKFENISLLILILSSVLLIKITRDLIGSYLNIPFFFVCFHILYGLSGVMSVIWGSGLSATYGKVFEPCPYMIVYSLCTFCLLIGMCLCNKKYKNIVNINKKLEIIKDESINKLKNYFIFVAICGFSLTLILELINFIRVGGFETLFFGKAVYQAAVDNLKLTFPTQLICQISLASLGVYIILSYFKNTKVSLKAIITCGVIFFPYLLLLLFLGRRGPILAYLLIAVLVFGQLKPLKKLSVKIIVILGIAYLSVASLYGVRNYVNLAFTDFSKFTEKVFNRRNIMMSLNPGYNEFGCTFGNFNKFYISNDYKLLYGTSYLNGLFHFVPTYLYPGDKPEMITYQFRDKYFSFKAEISSIASTAFSSILETFWNFWYFGAVLYVVYGYIIILLDNKFKNKNCFALLTYLSISPFVYSFHRSEFGHIIMEIVLLVICILFIYWFYKKIYDKDTKIANICHRISELLL